jgi:hypothetical protein
MKKMYECNGDIGCTGSTIFSTLYLTSGIWQMPLHKESVQKTASLFRASGNKNGKFFQWAYGVSLKLRKTNEENHI